MQSNVKVVVSFPVLLILIVYLPPNQGKTCNISPVMIFLVLLLLNLCWYWKYSTCNKFNYIRVLNFFLTKKRKKKKALELFSQTTKLIPFLLQPNHASIYQRKNPTMPHLYPFFSLNYLASNLGAFSFLLLHLPSSFLFYVYTILRFTISSISMLLFWSSRHKDETIHRIIYIYG